jgi:hypothetical protein
MKPTQKMRNEENYSMLLNSVQLQMHIGRVQMNYFQGFGNMIHCHHLHTILPLSADLQESVIVLTNVYYMKNMYLMALIIKYCIANMEIYLHERSHIDPSNSWLTYNIHFQ